jgi:hypothetical protein
VFGYAILKQIIFNNMETQATTLGGWIAIITILAVVIFATAIAGIIKIRQIRMATASPDEANKIEKNLIQSRLPYWFLIILGIGFLLTAYDGYEQTVNAPSVAPMYLYGSLMVIVGILALIFRKKRLDQIEKGITPPGIPLARKIIAGAAGFAILAGMFGANHESTSFIATLVTAVGSVVMLAAVLWPRKV